MGYRARDLFAGAGGWDLAARALGIDSYGFEIDEDAIETRYLNDLPTIDFDARMVKGNSGRFDLEIASPCCERFSITGQRDGLLFRQEIINRVRGIRAPTDVSLAIEDLSHVHPKAVLVLEPLRVLLENDHAAHAIWEQVVPVKPIWDACKEVLSNLGWSVDTGVVDASEYGVPQSRRRAILIARRDGIPARIPAPIPQVKRRVMGDVLDYPNDWIQRSNYSAPETRLKKTAAERGRSLRSMDQYSVTITRKVFNWITPEGLVPCSLGDQKILQTFPVDMKFAGLLSSQRLQVGNAVPPRLAWELLRSFG